MQTVLKAGQRLRNITIESLLGEGGMGSVWKGRVDIVDMPVAVKVMHPDLAASEQLRLRFLQEARAMAALRHDRIVPLNDFFLEETTGLLVLVMPLMEGRPLEDVFKDNPNGLAVSGALKYAGDVLSALAFAHEHGVVHRDVKPSNILITKEDKAYIMDFGIAKLRTESRVAAATQAGATIGTPDYMSPEQIRMPDQLDGRSDMYSLGCVLYEMLCGRPPFNPAVEGGERMVAVMNAHLRETPVALRSLNPSVPEDLERIVTKAMAKTRDERFADCREFAQALSRVETAGAARPNRDRKTVLENPGPAVTPRRPEPVPPEAAKPRSNQLMKAVAGLAVVAVMVVGVWMMSTPKSSGTPSATKELTVESNPPISGGGSPTKDTNQQTTAGGNTGAEATGNTEGQAAANAQNTSAGGGQRQSTGNETPPRGNGTVRGTQKPPMQNTEPVSPPPQISPQEQQAQQAAREAADLETKGPGNYCSALSRMRSAAQLSPQNAAYRSAVDRLKGLCELYQ